MKTRRITVEDYEALENMEMPCQCDCGNYFDLDDGYPSILSNKVICAECHENEINE